MSTEQNPEIQVNIEDAESSKNIGKLIIQADSTLSSLRMEIQKSWPQLGKFQFFHKKTLLAVSSQAKMKISKYIQTEKQILIKFAKKEKEPKKTREEQIKQLNETKQVIQQLQRDMDAFSQQRKIKNQKSAELAAKKIAEIEQKMKSIGMDLQFYDTDESINVARSILKQTLEDSNYLLQSLKKSKDISLQELVKNTDWICKTYEKGLPINLTRVLDENITIFRQDRTQVGRVAYNATFHQKNSGEEFKKSYDNKRSQLELNAIGLTPVGMVKASFETTAIQTKNKFQVKKKETQYTVSYVNQMHVGTAIILKADSVGIKKDIRQRFDDLTFRFAKNNQDPNLRADCLRFFKQNGYQIDVGTYYFGATYFSQSQLFFSKTLQISKADYVSTLALSGSLSGGIITQYGMFGFKGDASTNSEKATSLDKKQYTVSYSVRKTHKSSPNVQNLQNWRNLVVVSNNYWKLLCSKTERVPLYKILRNPVNTSQKMKELEKDYPNIHLKFEEYIIRIYENQGPLRNLVIKFIQKLPYFALQGRYSKGYVTFLPSSYQFTVKQEQNLANNTDQHLFLYFKSVDFEGGKIVGDLSVKNYLDIKLYKYGPLPQFLGAKQNPSEVTFQFKDKSQALIQLATKPKSKIDVQIIIDKKYLLDKGDLYLSEQPSSQTFFTFELITK